MSWTKRDWFFCLILAVVTILAYQPAWHGGLLWDDDNCTTPPELRSLDGLRRIWFVPRTIAQYYPLLFSSYWLQQRLWGDSTTGYHLVNLLLHIGCVVLVLRILRFLRIPGAELATIIFALHPVNVERWPGLRSVRTRYPESLPWRRHSSITSLTRNEAEERRTARRAVATGVMPWRSACSFWDC